MGGSSREPLPDRTRRHGQSHLLLALGSAAVDAGHRVRYYSAAKLIDTLYHGPADNSVGKIIDGLLAAR